jgi:hypothetical protein
MIRPTPNEFLEEEDTSLEEKVSELSKFFKQEPSALDNLQAILDRHLASDEFNSETAKWLLQSLSFYLGQDNAIFFLDLIPADLDDLDDLAVELEKIKKIDPTVEKNVRFLAALYGVSINRAYLFKDENPHSWRAIYPKVNYDYFAKKWLMQITIEKYNGEATVYEESPQSLVQLTKIFLKILNDIPVLDASNLLDREEFDELQESFQQFVGIFSDKIGGEEKVTIVED